MPSGSNPSSSRKQDVAKSNTSQKKTIGGNAPQNVKEKAGEILQFFVGRGTGFGDRIGLRIDITEVSIVNKVDEPQKLEGVVICEMIVEEGEYLVWELNAGSTAY